MRKEDLINEILKIYGCSNPLCGFNADPELATNYCTCREQRKEENRLWRMNKDNLRQILKELK